MTRLFGWLIDRPLVLAGLMIALVGGLLYWTERATDQRCAEVMALARTPHDSLSAKIACEQLRSDAARDIAISFSGGAAMGYVAGSRR